MRIFAFGMVLCCASFAAAEPPETRLNLARILVGEADGSKADWAAILWTLQHRAKRVDRSLGFVAAYSSVLRGKSARQKMIMSLGTETPNWGDLPVMRQRQWEDALAFVDSWLSGKVPDPCPSSMHWRGEMDREPMFKVAVDCGSTRNEFYYVSSEVLRD